MCISLGMYLIDAHLVGIHLIQMCILWACMSWACISYRRASRGCASHTGVHLVGMHLIGMYLTGMRLTGVNLVGVHLLQACISQALRLIGMSRGFGFFNFGFWEKFPYGRRDAKVPAAKRILTALYHCAGAWQSPRQPILETNLALLRGWVIGAFRHY
jgi:hypothetical protein